MRLVKITNTEDGEKVQHAKWHLVQSHGDAQRTVCGGQVFGYGESSVTFKEKISKEGGITCHDCIEIVKWYKSIRI